MSGAQTLLWAYAKSDNVLEYVKSTGMSMHGMDPYQTPYDAVGAAVAITMRRGAVHYNPQNPSDWANSLSAFILECHLMAIRPEDEKAFREEFKGPCDAVAWNIFGNGSYAVKIYETVYKALRKEFKTASVPSIQNSSCLAVVDKYNWDITLKARYGGGVALITKSDGAMEFRWDDQKQDSVDWDNLGRKIQNGLKQKQYTKDTYESSIASADSDVRDSVIRDLNEISQAIAAADNANKAAQNAAVDKNGYDYADVGGGVSMIVPGSLNLTELFDKMDAEKVPFKRGKLSAFAQNKSRDEAIAAMNVALTAKIQLGKVVGNALGGPKMSSSGYSYDYNTGKVDAGSMSANDLYDDLARKSVSVGSRTNFLKAEIPGDQAKSITALNDYLDNLKQVNQGQSPAAAAVAATNTGFEYDPTSNTIKEGNMTVDDLRVELNSRFPIPYFSGKVKFDSLIRGKDAKTIINDINVILSGAASRVAMQQAAQATGTLNIALVAYNDTDGKFYEAVQGQEDVDPLDRLSPSQRNALAKEGIKDTSDLLTAFAKDPVALNTLISSKPSSKKSTQSPSGIIDFDDKTNEFMLRPGSDTQNKLIYRSIPKKIRNSVGMNSFSELAALAAITAADPTNLNIGLHNLNTSIKDQIAKQFATEDDMKKELEKEKGNLLYDPSTRQFKWNPDESSDPIDLYKAFSKTARNVFTDLDAYVTMVDQLKDMDDVKRVSEISKINSNPVLGAGTKKANAPPAAADSTEASPYFAKIVEMFDIVLSNILGMDNTGWGDYVTKNITKHCSKIFASSADFKQWNKDALMNFTYPGSIVKKVSDMFSSLLDFSKYDSDFPTTLFNDHNDFDPAEISKAVVNSLCAAELQQSSREARSFANSWGATPKDIQEKFDLLKTWVPHCVTVAKDWYLPIGNAVIRRALIIKDGTTVPTENAHDIYNPKVELQANAQADFCVFAFTTHIVGMPDYSASVNIINETYANFKTNAQDLINSENAVLHDYQGNAAIVSLDTKAVTSLLNMCIDLILHNSPVKSVSNRSDYIALVENMINRPVMRCMMHAFALWICRYMLWKKGDVDEASIATINPVPMADSCTGEVLKDVVDKLAPTPDLSAPPSSAELIEKMIQCITNKVHAEVEKAYAGKGETVSGDVIAFWRPVTNKFVNNWMGEIMSFIAGKIRPLCSGGGMVVAKPGDPSQKLGVKKLGSGIIAAACAAAKDAIDATQDRGESGMMDWYMWTKSLWDAVPVAENSFADVLYDAITQKNYYLATPSDIALVKEKRSANTNNKVVLGLIPNLPYVKLPNTVDEVLKAEILDPFNLDVDGNGDIVPKKATHNLLMTKFTKFIGCGDIACSLKALKDYYNDRKQNPSMATKTPELWEVRSISQVLEQVSSLFKAASDEVSKMTDAEEKKKAVADFKDSVLTEFKRYENVSEDKWMQLLSNFYINNIPKAHDDLGIAEDTVVTSKSKSIVVTVIKEALMKNYGSDPKATMESLYALVINPMFDPTVTSANEGAVAKSVGFNLLSAVDVKRAVKAENEAIVLKAAVAAATAPKLKSSKAVVVVSGDVVAEFWLPIVKDFVPKEAQDSIFKLLSDSGKYDDPDVAVKKSNIEKAIDDAIKAKIVGVADDSFYAMLAHKEDDPEYPYIMRAVKELYDFYQAKNYSKDLMREFLISAYVKPVTASAPGGKGAGKGAAAPTKFEIKAEKDMEYTPQVIEKFVMHVLAEIVHLSLVYWYHRYDVNPSSVMCGIASSIWDKFYPELVDHVDNSKPEPKLSSFAEEYIYPQFYIDAYKHIVKDRSSEVPKDAIKHVMRVMFYNDFRRIERSAKSDFNISNDADKPKLCKLNLLQSERLDINSANSKVKMMLATVKAAALFQEEMSKYVKDDNAIQAMAKSMRAVKMSSGTVGVGSVDDIAVFEKKAEENLLQDKAKAVGPKSVREADRLLKNRAFLAMEPIWASEPTARRDLPLGKKKNNPADRLTEPTEAVVALKVQKTLLDKNLTDISKKFTEDYIDKGGKKKAEWVEIALAARKKEGYPLFIAMQLAENDFTEFKKKTITDARTAYIEGNFQLDLEAATQKMLTTERENYIKAQQETLDSYAKDMLNSVNFAMASLGYDVAVKIESGPNAYLAYILTLAEKRREEIAKELAEDAADKARAAKSLVAKVFKAPEAKAIAADMKPSGTVAKLLDDAKFTQNLSQI